MRNLRQIPTIFRPSRRSSMNFRHLSVRVENFPSTFFASGRHSVTFHKLPSTFCVARRPSVNVSCSRIAFCHFPSKFRAPEDLQLTSTNFLCGRQTFHQHMSTFRTAGRFFINFCQISMLQGGLLSFSINFPCCR